MERLFLFFVGFIKLKKTPSYTDGVNGDIIELYLKKEFFIKKISLFTQI